MPVRDAGTLYLHIRKHELARLDELAAQTFRSRSELVRALIMHAKVTGKTDVVAPLPLKVNDGQSQA